MRGARSTPAVACPDRGSASAASFSAGSLVRENRDHVASLDAHIALGGVGHERCCQRRCRFRARQRPVRSVLPAGDVEPAAAVPRREAWSPMYGGLGTGFTKSACHVYSTRNARKMARRTRRSIYVVWLPPPFDEVQDGPEALEGPDATSGSWYRIVACRTKRVTTHKAPGGEPDPTNRAMAINRLAPRSRRMKAETGKTL